MTTVFGWLAATLVAASAIGRWLERRKPSPAVTNLNQRIRAWWVMVAVGGLVLLAGRYAVIALFAGLSLVALAEFLGETRWRDAWFCFAIAWPLQYLAIAMEWRTIFIWGIPALVWLARSRLRATGLLICVYGLSHVPALFLLHLPTDPLRFVFYVVLTVQASDVLQYVWGKLLGRHPVAPRISPGKTVEGLVGGVASATAIGAVLADLTPFRLGTAALLALVLSLTGFLSGLLLSAIKRRRGLKDWSQSIPGHGGVLDRVDSLCLSAPVCYHLVPWLLRLAGGTF